MGSRSSLLSFVGKRRKKVTTPRSVKQSPRTSLTPVRNVVAQLPMF